MLKGLHWLLMLAYVAMPVVALAWAVVQAKRDRRPQLLRMLVALGAAGVAVAAALNVAYATGVQGEVLPAQVLLAAYFLVSMLLMLRGLDWLLRRGLARVLRLRRDPAGRSSAWWRVRVVIASLARAAVLIALVLPYAMAAVMTYRPRVGVVDDPKSQLGFEYEPVTFRSTDGVRLEGWWISAPPVASARRGALLVDWGEKTVIVCHGLGSNKANQLVLARELVPSGYNAFVFDFRAHGDSAGHLTSFGDLERRDVLGAVRWVRDHRPLMARRIVGVGASMGAAALIAAAADEGEDGRAIDAVAVYGTYDRVGSLARSVTDQYFLPPLNWLAVNIGLPLASVQVGTNLNAFSPAALAPRLWPRPILIVHGEQDEIIDVAHGQSLFEAATLPKSRFWIERGSHNSVVNDDNAALAVRRFFDTAKPVPVI